jgi:drug/metabolite transporter (DMT)-like permease
LTSPVGIDPITSARASPARGGSTPGRVHVALVAVQIAFGSLAVEGKLAMSPAYGVSPHALAMTRIAAGAVVFVVAHRVLRTPRVNRLRDAVSLALLSLFGIVLNQALFLAGLRQTSPMAATLLVATIPVFSAIIAAVTGRDRLGARAAAGVGVALFGVLALTRFALPARGDVLVVLNALSYAVYVVFAKAQLERYGTVTVVAWVFGCGALLFAPLGATALIRELPRWSPGAAALVAFVVLVPTLFAYGLNAWALRRAPPTLVAIYVYLQPILVATLAWIQLGQALEPHMLVAGVLIFAGVGLVATAPRQAAARG